MRTLLLAMCATLLTGSVVSAQGAVALPEGAMARLGLGAVTALQYSPDGRWLAVATLIGVEIREAENLGLEQLLVGHTRAVYAVAFSADGKTLASGSWDQTIKLWDAAAGTVLRTLSGHTGGVCSVAFSADGKTLASGSEDGTIKLWDAATGTLLRTVSGHTSGVSSVTFSPDGKTLASGS